MMAEWRCGGWNRKLRTYILNGRERKLGNKAEREDWECMRL
jgi:DNA polymerase II large subunit